ncbi:MAG TPA: hypothetical protein VK622_07225, partial [Puia sp.]|nr:hypothetical protein [Puia sp.]
KNGSEIYLSSLNITITGFVHAHSIFVKDSDVYVVGYDNSAGSPFPKVWYWKNGVRITINQVDHYGQGNSVFVSGSDVYIAGMEVSAPTYVQAAAYWKNGNVILLPNSVGTPDTKSIFVSGNDVYLAGYENVDFLHSYAVYWKDGVETKLTDGTHVAAANSIFVK